MNNTIALVDLIQTGSSRKLRKRKPFDIGDEVKIILINKLSRIIKSIILLDTLAPATDD